MCTEKRLAALEAAVKAHDVRITALENRLTPRNLSAAALDLLLAELEGQLGKEDV